MHAEHELQEVFKEYEQLVADVDRVFARVKSACPAEVKCAVGCCDCCYALFDLTLVEAMYLNYKLRERFQGSDRAALLDKAGKTDRQTYKVKHELFKLRQEGAPEDAIIQMAGEKRIRCPLLNQEYRCDLYDLRPITCRLYGIPLAIGGKGQTCGQSGFKPGAQYPTVHLEKIQDRLLQLSQAVADIVGSSFQDLPSVLVPLSMALVTEYDAEYLGVKKETGQCQEGEEGPTQWTLGGGAQP